MNFIKYVELYGIGVQIISYIVLILLIYGYLKVCCLIDNTIKNKERKRLRNYEYLLDKCSAQTIGRYSLNNNEITYDGYRGLPLVGEKYLKNRDDSELVIFYDPDNKADFVEKDSLSKWATHRDISSIFVEFLYTYIGIALIPLLTLLIYGLMKSMLL